MKEISVIKHSKGAFGLRFFGLGPKLKPTKGLNKLQKLLDKNAFWAKDRTINDLKKCLANSDVIISVWVGNESVGWDLSRSALGHCDRSKTPRTRIWYINCDKSFIF